MVWGLPLMTKRVETAMHMNRSRGMQARDIERLVTTAMCCVARLIAFMATLLTSSVATAQVCGSGWLYGNGIPGVSGGAGFVRASTMWDPDGPGPQTPKVVIAGSFGVAGTTGANGIVAFDPLRDTWMPLGSGFSTPVDALVALPNGDLIAGGSFSQAGGVPAKNMARWNGATWLPLGDGVSTTVTAVAVLANGDIVAGCSSPGNTNSAVVRFDGTTWSPLGSFVQGNVNTLLALPNGDLIAGGRFSVWGIANTENIARWNGTTWVPLGTSTADEVYSLARLNNGDIVAGGDYRQDGAGAFRGIARWNGTTWSAMGSGINGLVRSLAVLPDDDVVAIGPVGIENGVVIRYVTRWDGASWSTVGGGFAHYLSAQLYTVVALPNGDVIAGGQFDRAGDVYVRGLARWNGSVWSALGTGIGEALFETSVSALDGSPNGDVIAGGSFRTAGGRPASNIARWNGRTWFPLGSGVNAEVFAVAVMPNGDVVAGGNFTSAGIVSANRIARWNGAAWSAIGAGFDGTVRALVVMPNGDLIAGGWFTTAGGSPARAVARWNGSEWSSIGSGVTGVVNALAVLPNGDLVVGGAFSSAGGVSAANIARWNGVSWSAIGSGFNGEVLALASSPNGELLAGGTFTAFGSTPAESIARWSGTAWSSLGNGLYDTVYAVCWLPDGSPCAGGWVSNSGSQKVDGVARWNGSAWSTLGSGVQLPAKVQALRVLANQELAIGGNFYAGGSTSSFFGRYTLTGAPTLVSQPAAASAAQGADVTLSAAIPVGYSGVSFQWRRETAPGVFVDVVNGIGGSDGVGGGAGGTVSGAADALASPSDTREAVLTITNAQPSDAGSYTVVFSNACGSITSLPAAVTVEAACPSDLDNDGLVDDADFSIFVVAYDVLDCADPAMPSGCPADLTSDGLVNDDDFQSFIVAYNAVLCP